MNKKTGLGFRVYFFFKFMGKGVLYPYLVLYLTNQGFSGATLGLLLTLLTLGKVVLAPMVGYLCDLYRLHKPVLVLSLLLNGLGGFFLYSGAQTLAAYTFAIGLITLGETSSDTLSTTLAMDYLTRAGRQTDYGRWRLWGAVGFMTGSFFLGLYVLEQHLALVPLVFAGANLGAFLTAMILPKGSEKKPQDWLGGLKMLGQKPAFVILLAGGVFSGLSFNIIQSYYSVYMTGIGAASWMIGIGVALQVVIEIILSANTKTIIDRFPLRRIYLMGFLILPLRSLLYILNGNPVVGLLIQNLHGFFIFSVFIIGMIVLEMIMQPEWRSTGQSYYNSSIGGVGGMLGAFIAPLIFDTWGISAVWAFSSVVALIGFLLMWRATRVLIPE